MPHLPSTVDAAAAPAGAAVPSPWSASGQARRLLLLAVAALLGACAHLGNLSQKPEVSIAGLTLVHLGLFEQRFVLRLRVQNPNDVDLPVNGLSFEIELNGQAFMKGLSDRAVTVRRFGETVFEVMATSTLDGTLKQLRELQKSGRDRVDYRVIGRLNVSGIGNIPFERRGDLQMPSIENIPKKALPPGLERT